MQLVIVRLVLTHSFQHSKQWDPVQHWEEVISLETAGRYPIGRKAAFFNRIINSLLTYSLTESSWTKSHHAEGRSSLITQALQHSGPLCYNVCARWGWLQEPSLLWSGIIHSCNNWQRFLDYKNIEWGLLLWAISCCERDERERSDLILSSWHVHCWFRGIPWALLEGGLVVL